MTTRIASQVLDWLRPELPGAPEADSSPGLFEPELQPLERLVKALLINEIAHQPGLSRPPVRADAKHL